MIVLGLGATLVRVSVALGIALAWTIPAGVFIGMNPRWAAYLQPLVQIAASVPATAFFPIVALFFLEVPGGLNIAAIVLMLMGTQWYLLFNVIAGAAAIPQDLKYTTVLLHLGRWERWRTLILPALFPYIITGAITASGGAWNASIVAEYIEFGDRTVYTLGVGAVIARATTSGDYPLIAGGDAQHGRDVVVINRFLWRRLYRMAEETYRLGVSTAEWALLELRQSRSPTGRRGSFTRCRYQPTISEGGVSCACWGRRGAARARCCALSPGCSAPPAERCSTAARR
jgi:NitT/TauT family transport system permease protein